MYNRRTSDIPTLFLPPCYSRTSKWTFTIPIPAIGSNLEGGILKAIGGHPSQTLPAGWGCSLPDRLCCFYGLDNSLTGSRLPPNLRKLHLYQDLAGLNIYLSSSSLVLCEFAQQHRIYLNSCLEYHVCHDHDHGKTVNYGSMTWVILLWYREILIALTMLTTITVLSSYHGPWWWSLMHCNTSYVVLMSWYISSWEPDWMGYLY